TRRRRRRRRDGKPGRAWRDVQHRLGHGHDREHVGPHVDRPAGAGHHTLVRTSATRRTAPLGRRHYRGTTRSRLHPHADARHPPRRCDRQRGVTDVTPSWRLTSGRDRPPLVHLSLPTHPPPRHLTSALAGRVADNDRV